MAFLHALQQICCEMDVHGISHDPLSKAISLYQVYGARDLLAEGIKDQKAQLELCCHGTWRNIFRDFATDLEKIQQSINQLPYLTNQSPLALESVTTRLLIEGIAPYTINLTSITEQAKQVIKQTGLPATITAKQLQESPYILLSLEQHELFQLPVPAITQQKLPGWDSLYRINIQKQNQMDNAVAQLQTRLGNGRCCTITTMAPDASNLKGSLLDNLISTLHQTQCSATASPGEMRNRLNMINRQLTFLILENMPDNPSV